MTIILAIPLYYQTRSYPTYPSPPLPTTTAKYIALPPSSDPSIATRNHVIAKDTIAWGWRVHDMDPALPKNAKWLAKYSEAADKASWDDDIWLIWQREHGIRIAEADAKRKGGRRRGSRGVGVGEEAVAEEENDTGKLGGVAHGVKRLGEWARKHSEPAIERELRELEERKKELKKEERRRRTARDGIQVHVSEFELPREFTERLGGGGVGEGGDALGLTRHSWLSRV
ncbi:hypothetical protein TW65_01120 [Stemphylium lycopersici]|uniref:Uncharacterized protein n=1 Tax=Stemphylium lycopersici TaxID=183478 RepID=A0A364N7R5_STELY|nr:hypothetical protein TW65_01120 [Stemphylium lycopersici]RAR13334.1 hypothetical protein DDE83_003333 [Stemphylium lycopersici]